MSPDATRPPSRAERAEATQRALLDAAVQVIGAHGYAEASIARITQAANVAQGTFYNYFSSQQQLFEELLPMVGRDMVRRVGARRRRERRPAAKEAAGLQEFFDYLLDVPGFYRLLNESETFAPAAHRVHTRAMAEAYARTLSRAAAKGALQDFAAPEIEAIAYMLLGVRHYLAMRYSYDQGSVREVPDWVCATYMRLLQRGLFRGRAVTPRTPAQAPDPIQVEPPARLLRADARMAITAGRLAADEPADSGIALMCRLASAAAIAVADAAHGAGHSVASLALAALTPHQGGVLVATAELQDGPADRVVVQAGISADGPQGTPLATLQITLRR